MSSNDLLNEVCKTCKMGKEATDVLLSKVKDEKMRSQIKAQQENYTETESKAEKLLKEKSSAGENPLQKAALWGSIQANTLADSSAEHIAGMVMQGTTMGIIDVQKALNSSTETDESSRTLAENFVKEEEKNALKLKDML